MSIKYFRYFFIFLLILLWQSFFNFAGAQVVSQQGDVNINASVPSEGAGAGGSIPIISDVVASEIFDIKIDNVTLNSAKVSWKTSELAVPELNYGRAADLEKSYIGESFTIENYVFLENLSPQTIYYFEIIAIDRGGNRSFVKDLKFTTLGLSDNSPPANVSMFRAIGGDSEINLSWQNPPDSDFQGVKIFRSEIFYPKNQEDGALIYEGKENSFVDKNLINGILYYYTVFAYDFSGNYSSGAVAKAVPQKPGQFTPLPSPVLTPSFSPIPTFLPSPLISPIPDIANLKLEDFNFAQEGNGLKIIDNKIEVESEKSLVVSINFEKVPELAGTIMLILAQDGEPQSFLFKKDAKKDEYSVSFTPPAAGGIYSLTIALLDKKNNPMQAISGNLIVNVSGKTPEKAPWYLDLLWIFLILFIIMVLRAMWKIYRKAREKNKREKKI